MTATNASLCDEPADPLRRTMLVSFAFGYAAALIPEAWAQPASNGAPEPFMKLSELITGRASLSTSQASRLFQALVADDPQFPQNTQALLQYVQQHDLDTSNLQHSLDAEKSGLAELPKIIATAWFLGVVGEGEKARCLAFETALNAVIVSDALKPPTYAYGPYGSWARKPT